MSVRNRLIITFALVGTLLVTPAVFAILGLSDLLRLAVEERGRHATAALAVGHVQAGLAELDFAVPRYVALGDRRDDAFRALRSLDDEASRIEGAGYLEAAPPLRAALQDVRQVVEGIDRLLLEDRIDEAEARVEDFERASAGVSERLQELAGGIDRRAQEDFERARSIGAAALRTTALAVLVTIVLALLLSAWTTRALTQPLQRLRTAVVRVTEGDLEAPPDLPYERRDEIGELSASFGIMSRRLAELDRLRAEFLGVASHELKTPINVIRGYAELIEEELAGEVTPQQRQIMQRIGEQTRVLTRHVGRLMDISRLESGSYVVEPGPVPLSELVGGVERTFEVMAMEKGVTLTTETLPGAPEQLVVDVDLIRDEVLANLVSNALKFTPEGGQVRLRAWGEGEGEGGDMDVVLEVSDTGPGIPPEHRRHIFDKWYQVDPSRSIGSGLGLAIAKEMVEVHGGAIELVDTPEGEGGATFRVRLPTGGQHIREELRI